MKVMAIKSIIQGKVTLIKIIYSLIIRHVGEYCKYSKHKLVT